MRADFIQSVSFGIFKLVLLAALVVLGIVFVPDAVVDQIRGGVNAAKTYLWRGAEERMPAIKEDVARQAEETKEDAQNLYQKFQQDKWPRFKSWFIEKFIY